MKYDISVSRLIGKNDGATSKHFHYNSEMIFVTKGFLVMDIDGISTLLKENQLLIISSLEKHNLEKVSDDCERYIFRFSTEFLFEVVKDPTFIIIFNRSSSITIPIFTIPDEKVTTIKELFLLLLEECHDQNDFFENRCGVLLSAILISLYRIDSNLFIKNKNPMIKKIYEVQAYLNTHYMEKITLEELAFLFSISKSHMEHSFRSVTGIGIKQYIFRTRIMVAKKMLCSKNFSISTISEKIGFYDSNYFIKQFKKYENITPLQYRKSFFSELAG